jgi:hypothetical protein
LETYCEVKAKDSDALGFETVNYIHSCQYHILLLIVVLVSSQNIPQGLYFPCREVKKSDVTLQIDLASNFLNKRKYMYAACS